MVGTGQGFDMIALVFDTETTDLILNRTLRLDKQPEIIEFYGCIASLETGEIIEELHQFIKPKNKIDETSKAFKAHCITNLMVSASPSFTDVADTIKNFIEKATTVIAHNASFDTEMLDTEFERLDQKINWPSVLCTVEQTVYLKGYRMKLNDMHEYLFGERFENAHKADIDTKALLRCCCELYKRKVL
jgi:DNA polymerase III epsilon subunit family exonuclease